jgi:hypothetical protein
MFLTLDGDAIIHGSLAQTIAKEKTGVAVRGNYLVEKF